jgi:heptosyltransferase-1
MNKITPAITGDLDSPQPLSRILVVRLSAMGDIIHALPAVTALRFAFPKVTIGWVVEERWSELLCTMRAPMSGARSAQRPLVDRVHVANMAEWRSALLSNRTWGQIATGLSHLRGSSYELALDLQGAIRSALLARCSGVPTIYGFAQPRENAASMFYTRQVIAHGRHVIQQAMSLVEALVGHPVQVPRVEFPRDPAAEAEIERRLQERDIHEFAILNPGAGWGAKQWPARRFGQVATKLADDGLKSIINFGPGEEELARAVESASGGAAEAVACSISELIALTRRARIFIGGDTGPMHLAAALRVPVVGIFGPTDPARNGPFGTCSMVLRSPSSETSHARHTEPEEGLLEIGSDDVVAAARTLLRRCGG